jgi:hypothetical protein
MACESYLIRAKKGRALVSPQIERFMKHEDEDRSIVVFPRRSCGYDFDFFT